ncbi:MAG: class I SAM-dependent methyltransferase [Candidatus Hecatellaceae archaeon]
MADRREAWSRMAEGYDEWFRRGAGPLIYEAEVEGLRQAAEKLRPGLLLDVGCGTGLFSKVFMEMGWRVMGVDYALGMASAASAKSLDVVLADGCHLPFRSDFCDSVLMFTVLEFLPCEDEALKEAFRVLRDGGSLILGVHNRVNPWNLYRKLRARRKPFSSYRSIKYHSLAGLKAEVEKFSFKLEEACSVVFHPKTLRVERFLRKLGVGIGRAGSILIVRAVKASSTSQRQP